MNSTIQLVDILYKYRHLNQDILSKCNCNELEFYIRGILSEFKSIIYYYRENNMETEFREVIDYLHTLHLPTHIDDNTIGSYLYNCERIKFINKTCTPVCIDGLNHDFKAESCNVQVWIWVSKIEHPKRFVSSKTNYIDHDFLLKESNINSGYANIYVPSDFQGFNIDDINKLHDNNVQYISIYILNNGDYVRLLPNTSIYNLPDTVMRQIEYYNDCPYNNAICNSNRENSIQSDYYITEADNSYNLQLILFIVLYIILICSVIYIVNFFIRRKV